MAFFLFRAISFSLRIKLHTLARCLSLSFDTGARNGVLCGSQQLVNEEILPGRGLNPGLPNETPALYPLLNEITVKHWDQFVGVALRRIHF
jgi:hypothetical protein